MQRSSAKFIFVILVITLPLAAYPNVAAERSGITILSVVAPSSVGYDRSLVVKVLVSNNVTQNANLLVYYKPTIQVGWRVSGGRIFEVFPNNLTCYQAIIPDPIYSEQFATGTIISYFVVLTTGDSGRSIRSPEMQATVIDTVPPLITAIVSTPQSPTSADIVSVNATAVDDPLGSGVGSVVLHYSVNGNGEPAVMATFNGTDSYVASIPMSPTGSEVSYHVVARDRAGNEATTPTLAYQVLPTAAERAAKRASTVNSVIAVVAVLVLLAGGGLFLAFRKWRTAAPGVSMPSHPAAFASAMFIVLLVFGWVAASLFRSSLWMAGLVAVAYFFIWAVADPRINVLVNVGRLKSTVENPMVVFVFSSYVMGTVGVVAIVLKILENCLFFGDWQLNLIHEPMILFLSSAVVLFAIGIAMQLAWPLLRHISIEVEELNSSSVSETPNPEED